MNGVARMKQKLLMCGWKRIEGRNENQKEKMEFLDACTLRGKD